MTDPEFGAHCLDLVENAPLDAPATLGRWIAARYPVETDAATERDLADARMLRDAIARAASVLSAGGVPAASDVDVVNLVAATPDIPPALAGGTRQAGRGRARVGQALSELAREAVRVLADGERVRECAAGDCAIVFYDESRSNNRRWCSMQRCGNRAKVRAHRARGAAG
ncbi:CGNR zinc finger domain-containing protein [Galbitalea sp. SE-J8]|uniref:CGNR zinc finger domain-containing protein n=1 Tax=Galbitalea sp. SE-J8 TaxID=3054952 RepID=UPI00259C83D0|nr:CGNR zinc finger domain-containing protein [Galbitalea sp. SE-J8]MDM4761560.1 CGNR zinc finger domain-containing protein [Galbitalea sp. SE-J8]